MKNAATIVGTFLLSALVWAGASAPASPQDGTSTGQGPVFDSISIKRNPQGFIDIGGGDRLLEGYIQCRGVDSAPDSADPLPKVGVGGCGARNATVKELINVAYRVRPGFPRSALKQLISGGPPWAEDAAFDIDARVNSPATTTTDTFLVMLQNLLRDRFRLKVHRETRDVSGLALTVARRGSKLTPASAEQPEILTDLPSLKGQKVTVQVLANLLSDHLATFVIDQTQLIGSYNFSLEWSPDPATPNPATPVPTSGTAAAGAGPPASLVKALDEQLGLSLTPLKTQWDVIVIDGLAQPGIN